MSWQGLTNEQIQNAIAMLQSFKLSPEEYTEIRTCLERFGFVEEAVTDIERIQARHVFAIYRGSHQKTPDFERRAKTFEKINRQARALYNSLSNAEPLRDTHPLSPLDIPPPLHELLSINQNPTSVADQILLIEKRAEQKMIELRQTAKVQKDGNLPELDAVCVEVMNYVEYHTGKGVTATSTGEAASLLAAVWEPIASYVSAIPGAPKLRPQNFDGDTAYRALDRRAAKFSKI